LGNATQTSSAIPVFVQGVTTAVDVQAGANFTCALLANDTLVCWGDNSSGQLGNGTFVSSTTPVAVSGLTGVQSLAVGQNHACAVLDPTIEFELTTVQCWGNNFAGQVGNNTEQNNANVPVVVEGLDSVTALTAGNDFTCAAVDGGDIRCWGLNDDGQLGNGSVINALLPLNVSGATGALQLSAGNHVCALVAGNAVKCWGPNSYGELGKGTFSLRETTAQSSLRFSNVSHVEAAGGFTCALTTTGDIKCIGLNDQGQLGNGTTTNSVDSAVLVDGLSDVVQFDSNANSSCAVTSSDAVYCWGSNSANQLGVTDRAYSDEPVQVEYFLESATFETLAEKASAVTVTVGSKTATSVELSWTLPADDGGSSLVDYRIEYSTNSGTNWTLVNDGESLTRSYTVTGLAAGNYLFRVAAVTSALVGNFGTTSAVAVTGPVAPSKPGKATSVKGATTVVKTLKFTWKAATNAPTAYEYRVWVTGKVKPALWKNLSASATSVTVKGLKKGAKYSFEIRAKNSSGTGPSTTISSVKVTK
jgi:alpha-tubulin suppressor-like RCC1 family protein